jgi:uncharacterized lipoprotein YddW (UPF0748 family)
MRRALLFLPLLLALPAVARAEVRALWVTRYDYASEADVKRIVARAAGLGVNRLLFQVRGNASVFYASKLEPWSPRLGGGDPGFDPLAVAVREAKARGLAIEAWINVLPLWKGVSPPEDPRHPYLLHPEWVVVGSDGKPQRRTRHYVCANPARPDVKQHLARIAAEIAKGYAVDAVHLDYIRYVIDLERKLDFSRDPVSLKLFGKDPNKEPEAWSAFKAAQITSVVAKIRGAIRKARPTCELTVAVYPTVVSRARVFQDVETWVRRGLVDAIYPMTYAADDAEYARRLRDSMRLGRGRVPVYPGIAIRRHPDPAQSLRQVRSARAAGAKGFALFCYSALFQSADADLLPEKDTALRTRRAKALSKLFASGR